MGPYCEATKQFKILPLDETAVPVDSLDLVLFMSDPDFDYRNLEEVFSIGEAYDSIVRNSAEAVEESSSFPSSSLQSYLLEEVLSIGEACDSIVRNSAEAVEESSSLQSSSLSSSSIQSCITMTSYCLNMDLCCYFNVIFYTFRNIKRISMMVDPDKLQTHLRSLWHAYVPRKYGDRNFGIASQGGTMKACMGKLMKAAASELFYHDNIEQEDPMHFFTSSLQPLHAFEVGTLNRSRRTQRNTWFGEIEISTLFQVIVKLVICIG